MASLDNQTSVSSGGQLRHTVLDMPVNSGIPLDVKMFCGQIDIDNNKTAIFTIDCKAPLSAVVSCDSGTATVATEMNSDGNQLTVTITKSTNGVVNYQILVSLSDDVPYVAGSTGDVTIADDGTVG